MWSTEGLNGEVFTVEADLTDNSETIGLLLDCNDGVDSELGGRFIPELLKSVSTLLLDMGVRALNWEEAGGVTCPEVGGVRLMALAGVL